MNVVAVVLIILGLGTYIFGYWRGRKSKHPEPGVVARGYFLVWMLLTIAFILVRKWLCDQ